MKIYFITKKIEHVLPWSVIDLDTGEILAAFSKECAATSYATLQGEERDFSCCEDSITYSGWQHNSDCKGTTIYKTKPPRSRIYTSAGGNKIRFEEVSDNVWHCIDGEWEGTVKNGVELELHHKHGISYCTSFTESTRTY
jgi:hypothetical protein